MVHFCPELLDSPQCLICRDPLRLVGTLIRNPLNHAILRWPLTLGQSSSRYSSGMPLSGEISSTSGQKRRRDFKDVFLSDDKSFTAALSRWSLTIFEPSRGAKSVTWVAPTQSDSSGIPFKGDRSFTGQPKITSFLIGIPASGDMSATLIFHSMTRALASGTVPPLRGAGNQIL
jgi:hypothetical protein